MTDHSKVIFGNVMPDKVYRKAVKNKTKFQKKYGDDSSAAYRFSAKSNPVLEEFQSKKLVLGDGVDFPQNALIVGNIRMGFGHYRISMAMASAAKALGYEPYWLDLNSFPETTCTKIISGQNDLYSLGSRLSQKLALFNKLVWEPLNSEGFRKLSYNCSDQKAAELMAPVLSSLPKDIPYIATHVWPAQAAVHAGMTHVVNAIPDNWPMALHLAEGSIHTVQTQSSFLGYKALRGMDKRSLKPMPTGSLSYVGHYIDDELVQNIEADCARRIDRLTKKKARRYLLTVGGAGAQRELFTSILRYLLPYIKKNEAVLYINVGDHRNVWDELVKSVPELSSATLHFDSYAEEKAFATEALDGEVSGIHAFYNKDIFSAVYITNLLMRSSDVLITKPSELAFYPVPKLMIKRVGGHEFWGAVRSAEVGDGTYEVDTLKDTFDLLHLLQEEEEVLRFLCDNIVKNNENGLYDGAYKAVQLAAGLPVTGRPHR